MAFSDLLIHKVNTYDISFRGADDYNNPVRKLNKIDINSNKGCRVQHQITKEKAYSLSEIELLEESPVNAFFNKDWIPTDSNNVLGISFTGTFSDESFYLVRSLEVKYDRSAIHHYEVSLVPSSEFTIEDILGGTVEYSSDFEIEDNILIEYDPS